MRNCTSYGGFQYDGMTCSPQLISLISLSSPHVLPKDVIKWFCEVLSSISVRSINLNTWLGWWASSTYYWISQEFVNTNSWIGRGSFAYCGPPDLNLLTLPFLLDFRKTFGVWNSCTSYKRHFGKSDGYMYTHVITEVSSQHFEQLFQMRKYNFEKQFVFE